MFKAGRLQHSALSIDQCRIGAALTGDPYDLAGGPPVTALFVQNTNPAVVCPETAKCIEGLLRPDLFTAVPELVGQI